MANEKSKPYVPYSNDSEGTLVENRGQGATEPFRPNGWEGQFEKNTFQEEEK